MIRPAPKKRNKSLMALAIFFIVGLFAFDIFFLAGKIEDLNEPVAIHGPHFGSELTKYVDSQSEASFAATIKSRIRRNFYERYSRPSATPVPTVVPTVLTSDNKVVTNSVVISQVTTAQSTTQAGAVVISSPKYTNNGFGVAAGGVLTSYSQADLNTYFANLRDLGVSWVRWDIDWPTVQPNNSTTYNWTDMDRIANTAKYYGIKSLAIITYAPEWAEIQNCPQGKFCPPQDISTFANFAGKVAERYKGTISAYEIWNEENFTAFWYPTPNAAIYSEMLKQSYIKIKNVDSSAIVISGGLAATEDISGGSISPKTFIREMYSSGAKNYFDAVGLHPYSYPVAPDYVATWNSFQQMFDIKDIMNANNDGAKKIWITEYGAPTGGPGSQKQINQLSFNYGRDYMAEDSQDVMAKTAGRIFSQNRNWVDVFFWYSLRDGGTSNHDPENFFGLLRNDWSKKPAYDSLKSIISTQ